jgi:tetratricopeptide (TPR) repeat protein
LQLRLSGDEKGIAKKYTSSNEAYQLYLKGRYHWAKRTREDLDKAIDTYKRAIGLDPNFALAYVGMAEVYNSMGKNPDLPPKDCIPLAKAAAARALELDPALAQAHSAMGDSLALGDWNWAESEREFKRAIELDPNISYTYVAYSGSLLSALGRSDEALAATQKAVELEPLSLINNSLHVASLMNARRYVEALDQAQKAYELDRDFPLIHHWLGLALVANGKYDEAVALAGEVPPQSPFLTLSLYVGAYANARDGRRAEAEKAIAEMREIGKTRYVRTYYLACVYAALGDKDNAFAELERSFTDKDCYLPRVTIDPVLDPLREDPRFKDLIKRMGLL